MNQTEMLKSLQTYFDLMSMNGATYVFQVARKMGIVEWLIAHKNAYPKDLASSLGLQENPVKLMLDCLVQMGLLTVTEGYYSVTPAMHFFGGTYSNLGNEYWEHLPNFLKSSKPIAKMDQAQNSEAEYVKQVESLDWMMKPSAVLASKILGIGDSIQAANILDIGAGSGVWSFQMLGDDPNATCTLVDWAGVLAIAKKKAIQVGIDQRVKMLAGNYHELDFGTAKYEIVILGNVTHLEEPVQLNSLIAKAQRALKPGGRLVIFDVFPAQDKGKIAASLYTLGLALRTESGRVYTYAELKQICISQKLIDARFVPLEISPNTMGMIVARNLEN